MDVHGEHVLSEMAGAEFDNDDWVVFRHRERLFGVTLLSRTGWVGTELGVRAVRGVFLDLPNHGGWMGNKRDGRELGRR